MLSDTRSQQDKSQDGMSVGLWGRRSVWERRVTDLLAAVTSSDPAESLKQGQKTGVLLALLLEIQGVVCGPSYLWANSPPLRLTDWTSR